MTAPDLDPRVRRAVTEICGDGDRALILARLDEVARRVRSHVGAPVEPPSQPQTPGDALASFCRCDGEGD